MEHLNEIIFLGVDLIILGFCVKEYIGYKRTLNSLRRAEELEINDNLKFYVKSKPKSKIYAIIHGKVVTIGDPIKSAFVPTVTGVIQVIKLIEHRFGRSLLGLWDEQRHLIYVSSNRVPFTINNGKIGVEILDGISAKLLDLDVVYYNYAPLRFSLFDTGFGFTRIGIQTTEEMLRDGSLITAIGELKLDGDNLKLQPSNSGPMFLTTSIKNVLIRKIEKVKSSSMIKIIICGTISIIFLCVIGRRIYLRRTRTR